MDVFFGMETGDPDDVFALLWILAWRMMSGAAKKKGKKLHDPLAACVAVYPDICRFMFVRCYRERGSQTVEEDLTGSYKWGSVPDPKSKNAMSVACDLDKFEFLHSLLGST